MVAILIDPPQAEPVTRDEAKLHARIDGAEEDGLVDALITAARIEVENRTGRALLTQGWRIVRDQVPRGGVIRLSPAPVMQVDAVTVYGANGTPQVVSAEHYEVDAASSPGRIRFNGGHPWGVRALNGVEVDITCGYGGPQDVPAPLKHAVLMLVAYWYEQREAAVAGVVTDAVARGVSALLAPYRLPRLA